MDYEEYKKRIIYIYISLKYRGVHKNMARLIIGHYIGVGYKQTNRGPVPKFYKLPYYAGREGIYTGSILNAIGLGRGGHYKKYSESEYEAAHKYGYNGVKKKFIELNGYYYNITGLIVLDKPHLYENYNITPNVVEFLLKYVPYSAVRHMVPVINKCYSEIILENHISLMSHKEILEYAGLMCLPVRVVFNILVNNMNSYGHPERFITHNYYWSKLKE